VFRLSCSHETFFHSLQVFLCGYHTFLLIASDFFFKMLRYMCTH
jgi:hypothetical protein